MSLLWAVLNNKKNLYLQVGYLFSQISPIRNEIPAQTKTRGCEKNDSLLSKQKKKTEEMFIAFSSGLYDRRKSSKEPPIERGEFGLKIATFCLVWFILGTHKSVNGSASESHLKNDARPFWRERDTEDPSLPGETWKGTQEEEELPENEEEKGGSCGSELEVCPGNRPRSLVNCTCRALGWEQCGYYIGKDCDEQLGLQCINNTCVGPYHLKVIAISQNRVKLIWHDFKPNDYPYEYVMLYSNHFSEDLRFWKSESVGIEPQTLVSRLQANHGYFFRVATWEDPSLGKYGNISEAVFVKTKAGCLHEAKWYDVGDILNVECEEKCRCSANGTFNCEQLCPEEEHLPKMKDPNFKCFKELIKPSGCCYKITCLPIDAKNCVYNNQTYQHGDVWRRNCDAQCVCLEGNVQCRPICKTKADQLMGEDCSSLGKGHKEGDGCCLVNDCLPEGGCVYKNQRLKVGESFQDNCTRSCECERTGHVSCRPICLPQIDGEKPRDNCLTTYLPIDCCLSWICQPERRPFIAIAMSASFELEGPPCLVPRQKKTGATDYDDDKDVIKAEIRTRAEAGSRRVVCNPGGTTTGCLIAHVQVTCPANATTGNDVNDANNSRGVNFRVRIKWTVELKNTRSLEVLTKQLQMLVQDIGKQLMAKDFRILIQGKAYGPTKNWYSTPLTTECDHGFKETQSDCVETKPIIHSSTARMNLEFHVEKITNSGAVLKWQPLNQQKGQYTGNISIAHRQSESLGKWIFSESLNVSDTRYVLSGLLPGQEYNVKMVWQVDMFGLDSVFLATATFSTEEIPEIDSEGMTVMVDNNLHETFLLVTWERLPAEVLLRLETLKLVYQEPGVQTWSSVLVPDPEVTVSHKISVIKGKGNYTVRLSVQLKTGKTINILPTQIRVIQVVSSHSSQSSVLTGALVSVCVVVVVAFVAVILWRRRHRRRSNSAGYENKVFGLQLSETQKSSTLQLKA